MGIHIHKSQKVTNAFPRYIQVCFIKGDEKPQSSCGGFVSGSISLQVIAWENVDVSMTLFG